MSTLSESPLWFVYTPKTREEVGRIRALCVEYGEEPSSVQVALRSCCYIRIYNARGAHTSVGLFSLFRLQRSSRTVEADTIDEFESMLHTAILAYL